jgi:hypothetical protein
MVILPHRRNAFRGGGDEGWITLTVPADLSDSGKWNPAANGTRGDTPAYYARSTSGGQTRQGTYQLSLPSGITALEWRCQFYFSDAGSNFNFDYVQLNLHTGPAAGKYGSTISSTSKFGTDRIYLMNGFNLNYGYGLFGDRMAVNDSMIICRLEDAGGGEISFAYYDESEVLQHSGTLDTTFTTLSDVTALSLIAKSGGQYDSSYHYNVQIRYKV